MRPELLESFQRKELNSNALQISQRMLEDVSLDRDPDLKGWSLLASAGDHVVGGGAVMKDLEPQLAAIVRKNAYNLYYQSPYVRGVIRTLRKFVFGKGVTVEVDDDKNESLKEKAEEYLKEWSLQNRWDLAQKEMSDRSFRDGESFMYNRYLGHKKYSRLEFLEPDLIASDDPSITHGIELDPKDPTIVKFFHVKKAVEQSAQRIKGEDIIHVKLNVDSNVKRGRSILEPVFRHLKLHDDWLNTRIVLNRVRNAVALVRHVEGKQTQGEVIRKANQDTSRAKTTNAQKTFKAGTIVTAGPGVKYEMLSANIGASDAAQDGRNILLAIAVGVGFPEMFLTGDYSNANFASTAVAQNPFVREFEDWQDFFDVYIKLQMKRVLELGIKAGLLAPDTSTIVTTKWPPLTYEDFVAMSTALGQLFQNEIISKHTYAAKLSFDYEEEKEKIEDEQVDSAANDVLFSDLYGGNDDEEEEESPKKAVSEAESTIDENVLEEVRRRLRREITEDEPDLSQDKIEELITEAVRDFEIFEKARIQKAKGGVRTQIDVQRKHLRKNIDFRRRLEKKIRRGEHHTATMADKLARYNARKQEIKRLARRAGINVGPTVVTNRTGGFLADIDHQLNKAPPQKIANVSEPKQAHTVTVKAHVRTDPRTGGIVHVQQHERKLSVTELESVFKSGNIQNMKFLGGGVEETFIADAVLGEINTPVVVKVLDGPMKDNRAENEEGAVRVARELGLDSYVGTAIARKGIKRENDPSGSKGAVIEWLNHGMKVAKRADWKKVLGNNSSKTVGKLALFDYLVGNHDRHNGNWLTDDDKKIMLIDHERAFTMGTRISSSKFGEYLKYKKLDDTKISYYIGDSWDDKWPAIEKAMRKSGLKEDKLIDARSRWRTIINAKDDNKSINSVIQVWSPHDPWNLKLGDNLFARPLPFLKRRRRRRRRFGGIF